MHFTLSGIRNALRSITSTRTPILSVSSGVARSLSQEGKTYCSWRGPLATVVWLLANSVFHHELVFGVGGHYFLFFRPLLLQVAILRRNLHWPSLLVSRVTDGQQASMASRIIWPAGHCVVSDLYTQHQSRLRNAQMTIRTETNSTKKNPWRLLWPLEQLQPRIKPCT